jgi:regulator of protease activity HflC (stomatin/prohibitin superfamily)
MTALFGLIVIGLIAAFILQVFTKSITILEYERGLRYQKGKFQAVLSPGRYWYFLSSTTIHKIDMRPAYATIAGQEILSSDGVTIKLSLAASYEVVDPNIAINKVQNYQEAIYLELQLALRQIVAGMEIDAVLNSREEMQTKLLEMTTGTIQNFGVKLHSARVKDTMFPGKLKELFAQVINAKKEGLAALERARGESAALRNLANAAKLIEGNPTLLQLRLVQALGQSVGSSLVLGMSPNGQIVPLKTANVAQQDRTDDETTP